MSQIEDLHRRISRALDRIGQSVEKAGQPAEAGASDAGLTARLEAAEAALAAAEAKADAARDEAEARIERLRAEAEAERTAAVEAVQAEAAALFDKAVEAALAEAAPEPEALAAEPAPDPGADPQELARLREALEEEQMANAQLTERLRALKARGGGGIPAERVAQLEGDLQTLRAAHQDLLDSSAALREANAQGLADAGLIDTAMAAELKALRAARAAERTEVEAVIGTLEPMLAEALRNQKEAGA